MSERPLFTGGPLPFSTGKRGRVLSFYMGISENHQVKRGRGRTRSLTAEQRAEVCRRFLAGETQASIAAAFGVHAQTVRRELFERTEGIPLRGHPPRGQRRSEETCRRIAEGTRQAWARRKARGNG